MKFDDLKVAHNRVAASPITFGVIVVASFSVLMLSMAKHMNTRNFYDMQRVFGENAATFTAPAGPAALEPNARKMVRAAMDELHRTQKPSLIKDGIFFFLTKGGGDENCHTRTLIAQRNGAQARVGYIQRCHGKPDAVHIH